MGSAATAIGVLGLLSVAACTSTDRSARMQPEQFGSTTTHSRNYAAGGTAACEAARRALLSQGYVISLADADHVNGKKNFQPGLESHVEVEFHVVCAPEDRQGRKSIVFVNALQDRYALKKSNNSASLGVGVLGSVSLPFTSSDDSMVRVASETITTDLFYERFFALVDRYLAADIADDVPMPVLPPPPPMPMLAGSAPGASSPVAASAPLPNAGAAAAAPSFTAVAPAPSASAAPPAAPATAASAPAAAASASPPMTATPASAPVTATPASAPVTATPASAPVVATPTTAASAPAGP